MVKKKKDHKYKIEDIPTKNKFKIKLNPLIPSHPARVILVGGSGQGKSSVMFNLLLNNMFPYHKIYKNNIFVCAPTFKLETRWEYLNIPEENINEGEDMDQFFEDMYSKQEEKKFPPAVLVLDDVLPILSHSQKSGVAKLFIGGSRHRNISIYDYSN